MSSSSFSDDIIILKHGVNNAKGVELPGGGEGWWTVEALPWCRRLLLPFFPSAKIVMTCDSANGKVDLVLLAPT